MKKMYRTILSFILVAILLGVYNPVSMALIVKAENNKGNILLKDVNGMDVSGNNPKFENKRDVLVEVTDMMEGDYTVLVYGPGSGNSQNILGTGTVTVTSGSAITFNLYNITAFDDTDNNGGVYHVQVGDEKSKNFKIKESKQEEELQYWTVEFEAGLHGSLMGTRLFEDILDDTPWGSAVTVPTPKADEGYEFDKWMPMFPTKINQDWIFTAHFIAKEHPHMHDLTVIYIIGDGLVVAPPRHESTLMNGTEYNVVSPIVSGYTPNDFIVSGTIDGADVIETVTYTKNTPDIDSTYTITITYVEIVNNVEVEIYNKYFRDDLVDGTIYNINSPTISNYTRNIPVVAGEIDGENVVVKVLYTRIIDNNEDDEDTYTITITYVNERGATMAPTYFEDDLEDGYEYSIKSPTINNYDADKRYVTGEINGRNVVVEVVYEREPSEPRPTPIVTTPVVTPPIVTAPTQPIPAAPIVVPTTPIVVVPTQPTPSTSPPVTSQPVLPRTGSVDLQFLGYGLLGVGAILRKLTKI